MISLRTTLIALSLTLAAPAFAFSGPIISFPSLTFPESKTEVVTKQSTTVATPKVQRDE